MRPKESGPRGPAEHARRDQIVAAANEYFQHYGYDKTTVADLAKAIGFSTAYIYKFFDSKQSIGEAICGICLDAISIDIRRVAVSDQPVSERLSAIFTTLSRHARDISVRKSRLQDMVTAAHRDHWRSFEDHVATLREAVTRVVEEGRRSGAFERKTPIDETCRGILLVLEPFMNPTLWVGRLDELDNQAISLAALVLRSLTP
jgi:AcrR family transcriptional regulator